MSPVARKSVKPPESMKRYQSTTVVRHRDHASQAEVPVFIASLIQPPQKTETKAEAEAKAESKTKAKAQACDASSSLPVPHFSFVAPPSSATPVVINEDAWEPDVVDYVRDIYTSRKKLQERGRTPSNYMDNQKHVNVKMRAILIDWLWEVWLKFKLKNETMFLTVQLIDRYLAKRPCVRRKLQLVGVTAMLVAAKAEEIYFPEILDFSYITDRAYSRQNIIDMEGVVINALEFDLAIPTAYTFIQYYSQNVEPDCVRTRNAAVYAFGAVSSSVQMSAELPSQVAFGCMLFSLLNRHRLRECMLSRQIEAKRAEDDKTAAVSGRAAQGKRKPYDSTKQLPGGRLVKAALEQKIQLLERCAQLKRSHPCVQKVFKCARVYMDGSLVAVQRLSDIFPSSHVITRQMQSLLSAGNKTTKEKTAEKTVEKTEEKTAEKTVEKTTCEM